jgi:hypothetical protein
MGISARCRRIGLALGVSFALAVLACGEMAHIASAQALRARVHPYEVQVLIDGQPTPQFEHAGESYVLGQLGARYTLRIINRSSRRVEAVVSVDGLDVIDGKTADYAKKRGYLVPAFGHVDIEGWRLSEQRAAAFRFSKVADSYAARSGSARHVGVIGAAIFPELVVTLPVPVQIAPAPDSSRELAGSAAGHADARSTGVAPGVESRARRVQAT